MKMGNQMSGVVTARWKPIPDDDGAPIYDGREIFGRHPIKEWPYWRYSIIKWNYLNHVWDSSFESFEPVEYIERRELG